MKLRSKFVLITILSVVQVAALSILSLKGLKTIQVSKDYQLVQSQTQKQLSEIVNYLNAMEYWGFNTQTAYDNWQEILSGLDENIQDVFMVPQHIIGAAADDDAGALVGDFPDRVKLRKENPVVQGHFQVHASRIHPSLESAHHGKE